MGRTALLRTYSSVEVVELVTADSASFILAMKNGLTFIHIKRPNLSGSALFSMLGWLGDHPGQQDSLQGVKRGCVHGKAGYVHISSLLAWVGALIVST